MNTREYIESGTLEAYILGALSAKEAAQVEMDIAANPELAEEIAAIEATMRLFADKLAIEPPAHTKEKIWAALQFATNDRRGHDNQTGAPKIIPFQPEYRKPMKWQYAAIWAGLVGSLLLNVVLWNKTNRRIQDNIALVAEMNDMKAGQRQLADVVTDYQKNKAMMADTGMQTIVMHTMQPGHPMAATLYWSKNKGEAYVSIDGLPAPPKGMQYQLWVMENGKPVDMGVLPDSMANTPAMQKVSKSVTDGQAFAISLEKAGGSPTPTMQNIYVMGKV